MKRFAALLLAVCLTVGPLCLPAAAAGDTTDAVGLVRALGIMTGDGSGNLNLEKNVTRAEFCKMLVEASTYRNTVGGSSGYSLFRDVKSSHWAVEYIKVTVENGWMVGYLDGTFRPDQTITLEEAATVCLRLLGYTAEDLAGSYPTAQLSKFNALGLHAGFSTRQGETMRRSDCASLFYNLMAAQTKSGQIYAQSLGYTLDATGHVDYAALVTAGTEGPFTLTAGAIADQLPFGTGGITVYRNGAASSLDAAALYDVYYYNENLRTVWIYSNRITGTYTAASPSAAAPSSVTVAGKTYSIETSTAAYQLSTQGSYGVGDTITLLLGMNGGVADVCSADAASGQYYGVVTGSGQQSVTAADGSVRITKTVSVLCTDGVERAFETSTGSFANGDLVEVDYSDGTAVSRLSEKSLTGKVNSAGTRLGDWTLAEDVEILDTDQYGNAVRIYPSRLAGVSLSSGDVLFYARNARDEITHLILRDVTGDTAVYGVLTGVNETVGGMSLAGSYSCLINGEPVTVNTVNEIYSVSEGGAVLHYEDGQVALIRNLKELKLTGLTATEAESGGKVYAVSELVQVYIRDGDQYYAATIQAVQDTGRYTLRGYCDSFGYPAGEQIRIVIAEEI